MTVLTARRLTISAALVLVHILSTPALAGPGHQTPDCAAQKVCKSELKADTKSKGPKRGETIHGGRSLNTAEQRHLAKPNTGRAYRVVEDRVVLVDQKSMKIVQVLGMASDLLH
ncbi:hypothetical protein [Paracoccus laeviglucosivorans]|uniref:Nickel/cobalt transporter regulator n=1 Tax=Paracoccus laeviglucosivorans TaxID=1197861 RepID=A0A521FC75_9RHOB|nr:hypothetical protein [Paracoccus laeviglucosivorans]SMO93100.1 hypothetical protein SAMN06265221_11945 [Paracoccus laeviglucosivorans]